MNSEEVRQEYRNSLSDLTFNSRPLINMLTMLAEENLSNASTIVETIEQHLAKVHTDVKLPVLYLIDCIVKNIGGAYNQLFSQNIAMTFCSVFKVVEEKTRAEMFKLRQTWNEVFPQKKLYAIDVQIHMLDPAWPVTAQPPPNSIHFNPKFLKTTSQRTPDVSSATTKTATTISNKTTPMIGVASVADTSDALTMQQKLIQKHKELIELQKKKLELELLQTQVKLQKQLKAPVDNTVRLTQPSILLKPHVARQMQEEEGTADTQVVAPVVPSTSPVTSTPTQSAPISRPIINRDPRLARHKHHQNRLNSNNSLSVPSSVCTNINSNFNSNNSSTALFTTTTTTTITASATIVQGKQTVSELTPILNLNNNNNNNNNNSNNCNNVHSADHNVHSTTQNAQINVANETNVVTSSDSTCITQQRIASSPVLSVVPGSHKSKHDEKSPHQQKSPSRSHHNSQSKSPTKRRSSPKYDEKSQSSKGSSSSKSQRSSKRSSSSHSVKKRDSSSKERSSSGRGDERERSRSNSKNHSPKGSATLSTATTDSCSGDKNVMMSFKNVKHSTKNRNYVRRNRSPSLSPDPVEKGPSEAVATAVVVVDGESCSNVDLSTSSSVDVGADVDLRQMPQGATTTTSTVIVGASTQKKRASSERTDEECAASKKSKNEMFDILFGNEDTDLRQLPVVASATTPTPAKSDRVLTPPPAPIISHKDASGDKSQQQQTSEKKSSASAAASRFDQIRAKLANATGRDRLRASETSVKRTRFSPRDEDLRVSNASATTNNNSNNIASSQRYIVSADEMNVIKSGDMTDEQRSHLVSKLLAQIEQHKLLQAQKIEHEDISDDDLPSPVFSAEEEDDTDVAAPSDNNKRRHPNNASFQQQQRRAGPNWRGPGMVGHKRRYWDGTGSGPPVHGNRTWMQPPPPPLMSLRPPYDVGASPSQPFTVDAAPPLDSVPQDGLKMIQIDHIPREIRRYGETSIVFMAWDDPREISFQAEPLGSGTRRIYFGDTDVYTLALNDAYQELRIAGQLHRIRLGSPSCEVFIDGAAYECYFGGAPISVDLGATGAGGPIITTTVKLEGPPPQVKIGSERRYDLVAGKVNLIVDARTIIPVYLDGTRQQFTITDVCDNINSNNNSTSGGGLEGMKKRRRQQQSQKGGIKCSSTHTLQFVDALQSVLINDSVVFHVEFGGFPKPVMLDGKKHFIRFSALPRGVHPGAVRIRDMMETGGVGAETGGANRYGRSGASLPQLLPPTQRCVDEENDRNSNSPQMFHSLMMMNHDNMDTISNVMQASALTPTKTGAESRSFSNYQVGVHNEPSASSAPALNQQPSSLVPPFVQQQQQQQQTPSANIDSSTGAIVTAPDFNINDFFQKLVNSGILQSSGNAAAAAEKPTEPEPAITKPSDDSPSPQSSDGQTTTDRNSLLNKMKPTVNFARPETLKCRQGVLFTVLYAGVQCDSCGQRFPQDSAGSTLYSQHLDWHFRQNRKSKKSVRVAHGRPWYYSLADWRNFEEFEDLDTRGQNYFEQQQSQGGGQQQGGGGGTDATGPTDADDVDDEEVPSVPADADVVDAHCELCEDRFDQFFNEDLEEWHLRNAIRVEERTYHPMCYHDHEMAVLDPKSALNKAAGGADHDSMTTVIIPGLDVVVDLVDDDVEVSSLKADDEHKVDGSDAQVERPDSKVATDAKDALVEENQEMKPLDDDDDDVIINEVIPEQIEVHDDDEYPLQSDPKDGTETANLFKCNIKIKTEPMDPDEIAAAEDDNDEEGADTDALDKDESPKTPEPVTLAVPTQPANDHISSIDGNTQVTAANVIPSFDGAAPRTIRINISKPLPPMPSSSSSSMAAAAAASKERTLNAAPMANAASIDPSQPLPPGEEPIQLNIKPALAGVVLKKMAPVCKGNELTGMCSIM